MFTCAQNLKRDKFEKALKEKLSVLLSTTKLQEQMVQAIVGNIVETLRDSKIPNLICMGILPILVGRDLSKVLSVLTYIKIGAKVIKRIFKE